MIRKAKYSDAAALNHLLTLLIQDERKYDKNINENFVVTNMYENYIEDETRCLLVYEEQGQIVGYLYGYQEEKDATLISGSAKLDALFVLEDYRRLGIADKLILEFKNWTKNKNLSKINVNVCTENEKAKNLYQKHQFFSKMESLICELGQ